MQTHGIGGIATPHVPGVPAPGPHTPRAAGNAVPAQVPSPSSSDPGLDSAQAGSAPAGVDPMLWSQLTPAEQQFYMRITALGPLTYEPAGRSATAAPARGGRIDVRV